MADVARVYKKLNEKPHLLKNPTRWITKVKELLVKEGCII